MFLSVAVSTILIFLLSIPSYGTSSSKIPIRVQTLGKAITTTMIQCPEQIWHNAYSWYDKKILFVDGKDEIAYMLEDSALQSYPYALIPLNLKNTFSGFGQLDGNDAMSISLHLTKDIDVGKFYGDFALTLALHEGFHFWQQGEWKSNKISRRGVEYPVDWKRRYYRYELIRFLRQIFITKSYKDIDLAQPAYWFHKFRQEFPMQMELWNDVDIMEGSARYVDVIGTAVSHLGCQVSGEKLLKYVRWNLLQHEPFDINKIMPLIFGGASYQLGLVAGLVMEDNLMIDWQQKVKTGTPPANLLLQNITPVPVKK